MFEVWEEKAAKVYIPVAWFTDETDAGAYIKQLKKNKRTARYVFNETAMMTEWKTPEEFIHVGKKRG